ncbi:MAG: DUF1501 domain-containing protein [Desertimonas sp.]
MPQHVTRRDFLTLIGIGGGATALGFPGGIDPRAAASAPAHQRAVRPRSGAAGRPSAASDPATRVLVVIEMGGGNDGLSMAPPTDDAALRARRPGMPDAGGYLRPGNDVVLHPALTRLAERSLTIVDGVGTASPDGSHFEMMRRWWAGDPDGTLAPETGFLGRLCDALDAGAPATGVSIGSASSPALIAASAGTLGLPSPGWLWWLGAPADEVGDGVVAYRDALAAMARPDRSDGSARAAARAGLGGGLSLGDLVTGVGELDEAPGGELGRRLALAAAVIGADVGARVVHVPFDGGFDTHDDHWSQHEALMTELDEAVGGFLATLDDLDRSDQVVVATTSEFGRRPEENASGGLDHGTASAALLLGPVTRGRAGEPVDLGRLDDDDNFVATVSMNDYYATLAAWLDVDPAAVLEGPTNPLSGIW